MALWTCVLFGLAHATNLVSEGPKALLQVLVTAAAGYFFYLTRGVSKGLVVSAVLHGLSRLRRNPWGHPQIAADTRRGAVRS